MQEAKKFMALLMAIFLSAPASVFAANHREAPITATDRAADITDWFAFVSYEDPSKVVFILNVDPLLEPSNGPNYFPFDPEIKYQMLIDNTYDAIPDVTFEFRFQTEVRAPGVYTGFVGAGGGINAPANAPLGSAGTPVIPPAITSLDGAGAAGLSLRQSYTVTMITGSGSSAIRTDLTPSGQTLFAVPSNVGPRTMPNYNALAKQGIYSLGNGIRVFAGTVDDPFYIDLGATFDSANYRAGGFSTAGVALNASQDSNDNVNYAPDAVSGYNVNSIVLEVPISMITQKGKPVIGTYGATLRPATRILPSTGPAATDAAWAQIQRMGNPLINEVIIGTGSKDMFSMSEPKDDSQFAPQVLDPVLARAINAVFGVPVPDPPRTDLLPLATYAPPITDGSTPAGPVADLLRLNTSIPPTPQASRKRLGFIVGDSAGYPNGRRVTDDVVDISLRVVAGLLCSNCTANGKTFYPNQVLRLGDGVNTNDIPTQEVFPYVAFAHNGLTSTHNGAGQNQCAPNCVQ